jgi:hypothetical protein
MDCPVKPAVDSRYDFSIVWRHHRDMRLATPVVRGQAHGAWIESRQLLLVDVAVRFHLVSNLDLPSLHRERATVAEDRSWQGGFTPPSPWSVRGFHKWRSFRPRE